MFEQERSSIILFLHLMRDLEISACPHDERLNHLPPVNRRSSACPHFSHVVIIRFTGELDEQGKTKEWEQVTCKLHSCCCGFVLTEKQFSQMFHIDHISSLFCWYGEYRLKSKFGCYVSVAEWTYLAESTVDLKALGHSYILHTCQSCNTTQPGERGIVCVCVMSTEDKWRKCRFWP